MKSTASVIHSIPAIVSSFMFRFHPLFELARRDPLTLGPTLPTIEILTRATRTGCVEISRRVPVRPILATPQAMTSMRTSFFRDRREILLDLQPVYCEYGFALETENAPAALARGPLIGYTPMRTFREQTGGYLWPAPLLFVRLRRSWRDILRHFSGRIEFDH